MVQAKTKAGILRISISHLNTSVRETTKPTHGKATLVIITGAGAAAGLSGLARVLFVLEDRGSNPGAGKEQVTFFQMSIFRSTFTRSISSLNPAWFIPQPLRRIDQLFRAIPKGECL